MKKILLILAVVAAGCSQKNNEGNDDISKVENSLVGEVYFEGDPLWNIEERMEHYGVPGVSIAVISGGNIIWTKAYGIMDRENKEPVTTTTLFQAASISKPVSGYAVLRTAEQGKINLTDDVNTWLTSWKLPDNEFTKDRKVNVADLLSHTGGITVHGFGGYLPGMQAPTLVQLLDGAGPSNSAPIRVDKVPGGSFRYSGGGYCVMQQMMIDVYGKPFPEIEQELVLGPLEMNNSSFEQPLPSEKLKRAATGYLPDRSEVDGKRHTYPELAAAGLWTTAEDLAKFLIDIQKTLRGESTKVITKQTAEKMLTRVNGGMGLSMGLNNMAGTPYFGHGGWNEGFSSEMVASRDNGYGVVVMTNANQPDFISEVIRAVAFVDEWENYVPVYKRLPDNAAMVDKVVGRYRNGSDGRITITNDGSKLLFQFIRWNAPQELTRVSENTYVLGQSRAEVEFKTLSNGDIDLVITKDQPHNGSHLKVKDEKEKIPYEYFLAGDYKRAMKEYKQVMKSNPEDHAISEEVLTNNFGALYDQGKKKESREMMKIVVELYPDSEEARKTLKQLENIPE